LDRGERREKEGAEWERTEEGRRMGRNEKE